MRMMHFEQNPTEKKKLTACKKMSSYSGDFISHLGNNESYACIKFE